MSNKVNKPNLFIAGFPKSGTSSLYNYLGQHQKIFASSRKEPHTYTFDDRFQDRFNNDEYLSFNNLYSKSTNEKYIIDASTTYMISNIALKRIKKDTPDAKIIIIARDPIQRVLSHYNWIRSLGIKTLKFKKEIYTWIRKDFDPNAVFNGNYKNYIEFSKYGEQIERCLNFFPSEQVLILPFEQLIVDREHFIEKVFDFLEIDKPYEMNWEVVNKTKKEVRIKRNLPLFIKKVIYRLFGENSKYYVFLMNRKLQPFKANVNDEKFIYSFIKDDLYKLDELGFLFDDWKTVKKYHK